MYKNAQYRSQFRTNFREIHIVDAVTPDDEPVVFGNNGPKKTTHMREVRPKPVFRFSFGRYGHFGGKNLIASNIWYPISQRKGCMGDSPKMLNFLRIIHFSTAKHVLTPFFSSRIVQHDLHIIQLLRIMCPPSQIAQESYKPSEFPMP